MLAITKRPRPRASQTRARAEQTKADHIGATSVEAVKCNGAIGHLNYFRFGADSCRADAFGQGFGIATGTRGLGAETRNQAGRQGLRLALGTGNG